MVQEGGPEVGFLVTPGCGKRCTALYYPALYCLYYSCPAYPVLVHPGYTSDTTPADVAALAGTPVSALVRDTALGSDSLGSLGKSLLTEALPRVVTLLRGNATGRFAPSWRRTDKDWIDAGSLKPARAQGGGSRGGSWIPGIPVFGAGIGP